MDEADQVWIDELRRRDEDAWRRLHEREFGTLYRFARGLGADAGIAEDAVNEAFVRLVRHLPRLRIDAPTAIRTWLVVVCRNYVRDQLRRRRPSELREDDSVDNAERSIETRLALAAALAALPDGQREVIALRFVAGLPTREVAALVGRGEKAVESLQHRALEALRRSPALKGYA